MTPKRAAAYIGGFALLAAWLASAASTSLRRDPPPEATRTPIASSPTESLAADVQAHAERLRTRLASTPAPQRPARNPFAFAAPDRPSPVPAPRPAEILPPAPVPFAPPEPVLVLIGIAEDRGPNGPVRTAMLADGLEQLHMVKVGDSVMGQYRVEAIGADAIELAEVSTGAVRRLALRP